MAGAVREANQSDDVNFRDDMSILECFWVVTKMAVPLVLGLIMFLLVQMINTYFVGNLN